MGIWFKGKRPVAQRSLPKCLSGLFLCVVLLAYGGEIRPNEKADNPRQTVVTLTHDRTIHFEPESHEAMLFKDVRQIAVDSQSNLFLLDTAPNIVKCDSRGNFLNIVGRKGLGPGEYLKPAAFFLDDKDWLTVIDQDRFVVTYDETGTFRRRIAVENGIQGPFVVMPSGRIVGFSRRMDTSGVWKILAVFDADGRLDRELSSSLEKPLNPGESRRAGFVIGGLVHNYSTRACLCPAGAQTICFGHNLEYKLRVCDELGTTHSVIERDEIPESTVRIARELKKKWGTPYFDSVSFPPTKPFFEKLLGDGKGRIYVIRTPDFFEEGKNRKADVFRSSGEFLFTTEFPIAPLCVKNDEAFSIDYDEDGNLKIEIHKIPDTGYSTE